MRLPAGEQISRAMNRPKTLNALTDRTQAEIRHALDQSERNEAVIGSVLTGAGRGFYSGVDMNALGAMSEAGQRLGESYASLAADPGNPDGEPNFEIGLAYFLGLRKPLIAAINGACAGLVSATRSSATCVLSTGPSGSSPHSRNAG